MSDSNPESNWWWVDYMEGELDPTTHPDIEFLLEKSADDREEFESWRTLRAWVKDVDPAQNKELWSSAELNVLKDDILKSIEAEERKFNAEVQRL